MSGKPTPMTDAYNGRALPECFTRKRGNVQDFVRIYWEKFMEKDVAWPTTLVGWMLAMFDEDIVWKPEHEGEEPPF